MCGTNMICNLVTITPIDSHRHCLESRCVFHRTNQCLSVFLAWADARLGQNQHANRLAKRLFRQTACYSTPTSKLSLKMLRMRIFVVDKTPLNITLASSHSSSTLHKSALLHLQKSMCSSILNLIATSHHWNYRSSSTRQKSAILLIHHTANGNQLCCESIWISIWNSHFVCSRPEILIFLVPTSLCLWDVFLFVFTKQTFKIDTPNEYERRYSSGAAIRNQ